MRGKVPGMNGRKKKEKKKSGGLREKKKFQRVWGVPKLSVTCSLIRCWSQFLTYLQQCH